MTNENTQKLEALLQNPEEINAIFVGDTDNILANLAARGIEMAEDELSELCAGMMDGMGLSADGELSEEDLENVAGGGPGLAVAAVVVGTIVLIGTAYQFGRGFSDGGSGKASASKCPVYQLGHWCGKWICRGGR